MLLAKDIMTTSLVTVFGDSTVEDAARTLIEHKVSGLFVLERPNHLIGIITEFELLRLVFEPQAKNSPVSEFMRKDIIKVEDKSPIEAIVRIFIKKRIRRVPVVRDDVLEGVVSRSDIIRHFINIWDYLDEDERLDG